MKKVVVLFLLFAFTASGLRAEEKKFTLKNRYPQGKYDMVMNMDMDMTIEMAGRKMPMKQKMGQYMDIDAGMLESDGSQKIVMEITRVVMEQKISLANLKYDSADEMTHNSPLKAVGAMLGLRLTLTFDGDGKIVKVEGLDEFWDNLAKNPDYPLQAAEMLKKQMTSESMTKNFDSHRETMPPGPVAVGENWKSTGTAEMPMIGKLETELDNTLKVVKLVDGVECAEIVSKIKMDTKEPGEIEMGSAKTEYKNVSMENESTMLMEVETGLVISNVSDMKMEMEMETEVGDRTIEQKMAGTGRTTVTITRGKETTDSKN